MLRRAFLVHLVATVALLVGACTRPKVSPPAEGHLRVVSWNIEWFPGGSPDATPEAQEKQMTAVKQVLPQLKPDILLAQEVRDWQSVAQAVSIDPKLQVHVVSQFDGRPQNQAIVSHLRGDSAWSASWKYGPANPPRGYSFAALQLPDERFLLCYSLHLKSNNGELRANVAMRHESTRQLLQHVDEMLRVYGSRGPCGVIVGGDLNTSIDDPKFAPDATIRALIAAGFHWTHEGIPFAKRTTIPGDDKYPDNCFDHILTLGLGKPVATVTQYRDISDHNPVVADIDLTKADFQPKLDVAAGEKTLKDAPPIPAPKLVEGKLHSSDRDAIRAAVSQLVTVQGKVSRIGAPPNGSITFINFDGNDRDGFVAIVRRDQLAAVAQPFGGDLQSLAGQTITVQGKIELYRDNPQIAVSKPEQIKVINP